MSENDVVRSILEYLNWVGIFCWRNNTGATRFVSKNKSYFVRFGHVGSADILGLLKDGRFLAIECKAKLKYRLSPAQKDFIDMVNKNNGLAFVATCLEDVNKEMGDYLEPPLKYHQS